MDDDGRVEENTLDNTTTDDEDDLKDVKKNQRKCLATAHATNFDDIADGERHDPDCEEEEDTNEHNHLDVNGQEESTSDIDSNFAITSASPYDETR